MKRLVCWIRGHDIAADVGMYFSRVEFVYCCKRCGKLLAGPRP
jgi:hypothetical protein